MIIGTAGHIDHGKTTLVRALTGVDTDRLKEEKARGISIELGYAYTPVPDQAEILGFIDVPGHEKFIHTMAAGAVGIDHVLLVIAADDGIMPQTREHLAIIELLGVQQGTVALTKADRVSPDRLAEVKQAIAQLLEPTPLASAPVYATNAAAPDDAGTAALRQHLLALAQQFPARTHAGLFRLAVDRAFTLQGQGTVVTGTVFGGSVHTGDQLRHSGSGQMARVRSIHAQNQLSQTGLAGQRVALNLAGIDKDTIARGDWMADPLALQATRRLDVRLRVLPKEILQPARAQAGAAASGKHEPHSLQQWSTVHLHIGTTHHVAHVVPLQSERMGSGEQGLAQLVLDADLYAMAGDHFILRNAQASHTLAGGTVLDPYAPERKRRSAERLTYLQAIESSLAQGDPSALIQHSPWGISRLQLARLFGWSPHSVPTPAGAVSMGKNAQDPDPILLSEAHWQALQQQVHEALQRFHERSPDEPGVNAARLRRMGLPGLSSSKYDLLWQGLLGSLLEQGQISQTGPWLHAPGHSVQLSAPEEQMAQMLLPDLEDGQFDPPWVRDLARDHGLAEDTVRALLRKLARQGRLYQVIKDLFYSQAAIAALQTIASDLAAQSAKQTVEAKHFRDATGLGRKRAIQVLEYFDRSGFTRRVRDSHVLRQ